MTAKIDVGASWFTHDAIVTTDGVADSSFSNTAFDLDAQYGKPGDEGLYALVEYLQGKDASALARDIEKALGKFIRDPIVTVEVTTFTGPYDQQVRVVGEVQKPQTLPYRQDMTLLDVMIAVGGVTDFADGNAATILRTGDGNKQYRVRIRDLVKRGDVSANVPMQPGDVIFIPQSWF